MDFQGELITILYWIFGFMFVPVIAWALFLGMKFATASDEGKRKEAKRRLFNGIVTIVLLILLVGILAAIDFMAGTNIYTGPAAEIRLQIQNAPAPNSITRGQDFNVFVLKDAGSSPIASTNLYRVEIVSDGGTGLTVSGGVGTGFVFRGTSAGTASVRVIRDTDDGSTVARSFNITVL